MSNHGASLKTDLTNEQFALFADYIQEHSGIHIEESRIDALRISLVTRATRFGFDSFERYHALLAADEGEFRELMNLITVNETSFFRFPAQFDALANIVIPEVLEGRSAAMRSFRVWSAGCSTGEEPYSIAMTLLDAGIEALGYRTEVLGTDVSTSALERAKSGVYPPRALLNVPRDMMERYFEPTALGHRVTPALRDTVGFRYQNLVKEPFPTALMGGWDVIFCRNVTIYFRIESTRRVVESLFESLNPGGYLFIGHSETLTGITGRFETVEAGGVFLHRKPMRAMRVSFPEFVEGRRREQRPREDVRACGPSGADPGATAATDAAALLDAARTAITAGRSHEALDAARAVLDAMPGCAEAHLIAARALADDGDFDAAIDSAQAALCINPLLASARYVLGLIHLREGRADGAMAEFRRTVYADDSFVLAHLNLGNLHRARGDFDHACRSYERARRALEECPDGPWTAFLGGFEHRLLAATCARSLEECSRRVVSA